MIITIIATLWVMGIVAVYAMYAPTAEDRQLVQDLDAYLAEMPVAQATITKLEKYETAIEHIQIPSDDPMYDRKSYLLDTLSVSIANRIVSIQADLDVQAAEAERARQAAIEADAARRVEEERLQAENSKAIASYTSMRDLAYEYKDQRGGKDLPQVCLDRIPLVTRAVAGTDWPAPVVLGIWYRETTCRMSNPANGRGLFQITTQNLTPGAISEDEAIRQIKEYIAFSQGKIDWYNKGLYKRKGYQQISLTDGDISLLDLQIYALMYNGWPSSTSPATSSYANNNLKPALTKGGADGVVTAMLKAAVAME